MSTTAVKTIEQAWQEFQQRVIAAGAPDVQRHEMRIAFYAGYSSSLAAVLELAGMDQRNAVKELERLHAQSRTFWRSL